MDLSCLATCDGLRQHHHAGPSRAGDHAFIGDPIASDGVALPQGRVQNEATSAAFCEASVVDEPYARAPEAPVSLNTRMGIKREKEG